MAELSEEVKAARKAAAEDTRIVRRYLEGVRADRKLRGSGGPGGIDGLRNRLAKVDADLNRDSLPVVDRLRLTQRRLDIVEVLENLPDPEFEKAFVEVGARWADHNEIGRSAFVLMGVPAPVLDAAGITD